MSKIVVITGSPRANGNSNMMASAFIEAAEKAGAEVKRFDACKLNLVGCRACGGCYKTGHACAFEHAYDAVADAIVEADTVVFTMPVYYFGIPAQIKALIDHMYCFIVGGKDIKGKKCLVLGTSGQAVENGIFEGITAAMKRICSFPLTCWDYEEYFVGSMNEPGAIAKTDALAHVAELANKYI